MKRIITIFIILLIIGLVGFRLASNKKTIASRNKVLNNTDASIAVNTAVVKSAISEKNLTLVGTVIANQEIDVKSEVQGKITSLPVELGDFITKGKTIARIDDKIRSLSVGNAEQKLADAKQNLERYKNLYEGGAASKAQYDQYKLAYENAENQLQQSKKELNSTAVVAPISGYITTKAVEAGAFANIGASIVTIVDISKLKVKLSVPERDAYALKVGDPVKITTSVYPGIEFQGKISFVSPSGDESHNYPIEISITNQDKNPLKAGTYVDIAFNRKNQVPVLQIPREALVGSIKDAKVYVVENGIARLKKITIGTDNGSSLEVLNGLKEEEKVVTTGQINLIDSAKVTIIK